jgi:hypothetical protein
MVREIVSRTGRTWIDEQQGILRFESSPGAAQGLADAKENIEAIVTLSEGEKKYPLLFDLTRCKALNQEAREYYGRMEARSSYRALALLGRSPTSKMIGSFWFAIYGERDAPTKVFASEADAMAWLKGFAR